MRPTVALGIRAYQMEMDIELSSMKTTVWTRHDAQSAWPTLL
jgi:hypothetical protein